MKDAIVNFFLEAVGREWCVFFCSLLPIIELRGAIPLGAGLGLPWWQSYIISVIGNMLPVPFILLFIKAILGWMSRCRVKLFNRFAGWLYRKVDKNREKIERRAFWGLFLFVAIPLPGTGAWTGALIAALLDIRIRRAIPTIFLGVLIAGAIVTALSYGVKLGVSAVF